jgi:benzoate transport
MSSSDPCELIDQSAMKVSQIAIIAIAVLLNAMDGFDILSIAFASPGIAREWHINQLELGIVLSMELIGMALGSILLGGFADKLGRRPTLLSCLVVMTAGMILATSASSLLELSIWRVVTGLGIGGMLSCTNAVVAEFSNAKWRGFCISVMVIGYPLGGGLGGLFASSLISRYDWRSVFYLGAAATATLLPIAFFLVPESVHWLARNHPVDAVQRINASLRRLGRSAIASLPKLEKDERTNSLADIFSPSLIGKTLVVTSAYFLHILTFYFFLKWTPKVVVDMGFAPADGGRALTMANFGGAAGGASFGLLAARFGLQPPTIAILVVNAIAVAIFGHASHLSTVTLMAVVVGFFSNAAVSGLYSIAADVFPTHVRATGTGFVIGIGRAGGVLSPWLVGYLFEGGVSLPHVALVLCAGSTFAAAVLLFLKTKSGSPVPENVHAAVRSP